MALVVVVAVVAVVAVASDVSSYGTLRPIIDRRRFSMSRRSNETALGRHDVTVLQLATGNVEATQIKARRFRSVLHPSVNPPLFFFSLCQTVFFCAYFAPISTSTAIITRNRLGQTVSAFLCFAYDDVPSLNSHRIEPVSVLLKPPTKKKMNSIELGEKHGSNSEPPYSFRRKN